jgi:hypothetical protein
MHADIQCTRGYLELFPADNGLLSAICFSRVTLFSNFGKFLPIEG